MIRSRLAVLTIVYFCSILHSSISAGSSDIKKKSTTNLNTDDEQRSQHEWESVYLIGNPDPNRVPKTVPAPEYESDGKIHFKLKNEGDAFYFFCPAETESEAQTNYNDSKTAQLLFLKHTRSEGLTYESQDTVVCKHMPKPSVIKIAESDIKPFEELYVGYEILDQGILIDDQYIRRLEHPNNAFYTTLFLKMDKESPNSAVFSRYTLENALYLQRKVDILSEGIVTEAELFELLEEQKQKFQLLAEFKADGFRFPGLDIDTRLTIIQLVPSSDFFHMYDKQIAHDKHNRAIMWAHIYHMSWEPIEDRIRKYAESKNTPLMILTGTHGLLEVNGSPLKLEDNGFIVPSIFWKFIYNENTKQHMFIVTSNDPFTHETLYELDLCTVKDSDFEVRPSSSKSDSVPFRNKNIGRISCNEYGWTNSHMINIQNGHTFCCQINKVLAERLDFPTGLSYGELLNISPPSQTISNKDDLSASSAPDEFPM